MKQIGKYLSLAAIGALTYVCIELLWRGYTHWTSFVMGAAAFIFMGILNEIFRWDTPLTLQMLISAAFITCMELFVGKIFNADFVAWDYRNMPFNYEGQICPMFSLLWCGLSLIGIVLDDYIRYIFFHEEKPHYKWFS